MAKAIISIGCDHAGYQYKEHLREHLIARGYEIIDHGTFSDTSVDYPDFVHPTAKAVEAGESNLGILICGSANGVCMTANKHQGIRAAICWTEEITSLARKHNNANIICLPARFVDETLATKMTEVFINTEFEGGRHQRRVGKIALEELSC